jgi:hypothetical protein
LRDADGEFEAGTLLSGGGEAFSVQMKSFLFLFLAVVVGAWSAGAADALANVSVLDNSVLFVQASRVPENVPEQIRATTMPKHLDGMVLDLRFADGAATNAADYFTKRKSPLVILVNSQTRGAAAALATALRESASAVLIGSTNAEDALLPDIFVAVSAEEEKKFQENPFFKTASGRYGGVAATNLLAFVDHTSEADLVRKRIKDGEEDGDLSTPRAEPPQPVIQDPALARAIDLLKALAVLHAARG